MFCVVEPCQAMVNVPDPRLDRFAQEAKAKRTIYDYVQVHDIAGLIKGASQGAGLGNAFLGHIRNVDAIVHVVRCFQDSDVIHVNSDERKD